MSKKKTQIKAVRYNLTTLNIEKIKNKNTKQKRNT